MFQNSGNRHQQSNHSRPPATIRDGLSVQELKAMTAMRMAQNNEPLSAINHSNSANPASTYQTATPQQLQAAGIQPVVINDRNPSNIQPRPIGRPAATASASLTSSTNIASAFSGASRYELNGRQDQNDLSPYHQQLLSRGSVNTTSSMASNSLSQVNHLPSRQFLHDGRSSQSSSSWGSEGSRYEVDGLPNSNFGLSQIQSQNIQKLSGQQELFPRRNFLEADRLINRKTPPKDISDNSDFSFDVLDRPFLNGNGGSRNGDTRNMVAFGHENTLLYHRGPEVRTPITGGHNGCGGLDWDREVINSQQPFQRNTALPVLEISPSKILGNEMNANSFHEPNRSRLVGVGSGMYGVQMSGDNVQANSSLGSTKSRLLKSNSQPTIQLEDFASLVIGNSSSHSFMELSREMSPANSSLTVSQAEKSPSKFPMIKSKTAPRLSISPNDLLPAISPSKSSLTATPGKSTNRDANFLSNEVAESVLDVLSPFPSLSQSGKQRLSNNAISDSSNNNSGFFGGTDLNDPRFSWDGVQ